MNIEIINTGTELMLGRRLNTHAQWLCQRLSDRGYCVGRQVAIDDSAVAIGEAVAEALPRADLILTTGGLGPTSDDRTRDLIAELLGLPLREDAEVLRVIEGFFAQRKRPMPLNARRQALVPEGARVLSNSFGTAPGLAIPTGKSASGLTRWLVMLPGPPRELRPMFVDQVIPLLSREFPLAEPFVCRTYCLTGIGESFLEERIATPLQPFVEQGMEIAYCARPGEVDLRLSMRGPLAEAIVIQAEALVERLVGSLIFGRETESLESVVIAALTAQQKRVATAESCTGGLIAHRLTNVPGASAVFMGGFVTYSNETKQSLLGVSAATLSAHGAVSEATAREMAVGVRTKMGVDFGVSVTGIAGPSGGSAEKPVGTVFIGLASASGVKIERQFNPYDRETFKEVTAQQALEMLRRALGDG